MDFIPRKTFSELIEEFRFRMYVLTKRRDRISGILSGFEKLDAITKGFQPSNLTLIGGVAGMGKTAFALSLIRKMAIEKQYYISYFSLELTSQQLMTSIIRQQTNISAEKLRLGSLNENESELVAQKTSQLKNTPLEVYDHPFLTVTDIENTLLCSPPDFAPIIIIDSLQLIAKNKKEEVGKTLNKKELAKICFQLKQLAVKFNVSIIVLFNFRLLKEKEKYYYSKRPMLADVRKYAPIDTYADLVLLLYRPEYYKIDEWDDDEQSPTAGEAEIIVAKNTNGSLDNARVKFDGSKALFDNLSSYKKMD
jgi:replicative DNA helicase